MKRRIRRQDEVSERGIFGRAREGRDEVAVVVVVVVVVLVLVMIRASSVHAHEYRVYYCIALATKTAKMTVRFVTILHPTVVSSIPSNGLFSPSRNAGNLLDSSFLVVLGGSAHRTHDRGLLSRGAR
jgi:hypothetical protein